MVSFALPINVDFDFNLIFFFFFLFIKSIFILFKTKKNDDGGDDGGGLFGWCGSCQKSVVWIVYWTK